MIFIKLTHVTTESEKAANSLIISAFSTAFSTAEEHCYCYEEDPLPLKERFRFLYIYYRLDFTLF